MAGKKDWEKTLTIYWSDELNDDFDELGLERPKVPDNYNYKRGPISNFLCSVLYHVFAKPFLGIYCYFHGIRYVGRKNLKALHGQGAFIYANHVAITDVFKFQSQLFFFKRKVNILGYPDSLTIPVAKHLVKGLGLLPVPTSGDLKHMIELEETCEYYVKKKKQHVIIFPEAHIWPYYTHIRNFKSGSFIYPAKANAPVVPIVTTFKKKRFGKKPKQVVYVCPPIFPREDLNIQENKEYLHDECLKAMKLIAENTEQYEYVKYIKVDKKD